MAVSGPSSSGGGGIFADINITPLTDIFLVLLIIFMVTTTAIAEQGGANGGLKVSLPKGGKSEAAQAVHDVAVAVLQDGRTVVGGKVVADDELSQMFGRSAAHNPDTLVLVQADEGV